MASLSIIIPTYNHGASLVACLESIKAQSRRDYEVIIVDDGSSDDTAARLTAYRALPGSIPFRYELIPHGGAPRARNHGADLSDSEFLLFLDADVLLRPTALEKMTQALSDHLDAAYAYGDFLFGGKLMRAHEFDAESLRRSNYIHTSSLVRRSAFPRFDESLARFQDWDLWLTILALGGTGVYIPEVLFHARVIRPGISQWKPRVAYRVAALLQRVCGWSPAWYRRYMAARDRIIAKHDLL